LRQIFLHSCNRLGSDRFFAGRLGILPDGITICRSVAAGGTVSCFRDWVDSGVRTGFISRAHILLRSIVSTAARCGQQQSDR
jgi:hypothetical protein